MTSRFSNKAPGLPNLIYIGAIPIVCIFLGVSAEANNPIADIHFWERLTRRDLIFVGVAGEGGAELA